MAEDLLAKVRDGVIYLTINREDQRNAMNAEVLDGISAALGSRACRRLHPVHGIDRCGREGLLRRCRFADRKILSSLITLSRIWPSPICCERRVARRCR